MRVSYNWLREYVPVKQSPTELAELLTMAGLEVDEIIDLGASYRDLVLGEVAAIERHPKADQLYLCRIRLNDGEVSVITAAPNLSVGDIVPIALPGSTLPDGKIIQPTEFFGIVSQGMLCSEEELGLARKSEGIMVLPAGTDLKADLPTVLGLDDYVLVLELTPNRADCYGMLNLAREVAALTNTKITLPEDPVAEIEPSVADLVTVEVLNPDLAPRYAGRVLLNLKIGESPLWLKTRLLAAGMRPINNLVDLTNYVMLEFNQPLHAFDLNKMEDRKILVRSARQDESIITLDGEERKLHPGQLVIADAAQAQCIAGVMGAFDSEVTSSTQTIFLESAYFAPVSIRRTAQELAIRSEAAIRFGKGLDPETVPLALNRVASLAQQLGIAQTAKGIIDYNTQPVPTRKIWFRPEKINALLGTELEATYMKTIFQRLNFQIDGDNAEGKTYITPPSYRLDIENEADLAEEVARIYGYNEIPVTYPAAQIIGKRTPQQEFTDKTRNILLGLGLSEIITYSFHGEKMFDRLNIPEEHPLRQTVKMKVALSEEGSLMRTTLLPGVLESLSYNASRNRHDLQIFEIAHVYHPKAEAGELPDEPLHLAGGLSGRVSELGWNQSNREVDFYDGKGVLETLLSHLRAKGVSFRRGEHPTMHPGRTAVVEAYGRQIGFVGEIHPAVKKEFNLTAPVVLFELNLDELWQTAEKEVISVSPLPKFPPILRDLAFLLPEKVAAKDLINLFYEIGGDKLEAVNLFDVYQGDKIPAGYRSLAFSLTFRIPDRTLQDEEVNLLMEKIINTATQRFKAQLRA
ncbi:MAG TPA: phenylalanine--tRNA ligase subunit beta [Firmicutes bacterium]|nr:phenylalanine--tRNA ligase subunit beta [Bacillota bacterium]